METVNIISSLLLIPHFIYMFIAILIGAYIVSVNPNTDIKKYKQILDYFPKEIPDNYKEVKYYRSSPFLQSGEECILYLKMDTDFINYYKEKYQDKTVRFHKNASDPYINGFNSSDN